MKRLSFLLAAVAALVFCSCGKDETIVRNYNTYSQIYSYECEATPNMWQTFVYDGYRTQLYTSFEIPAITEENISTCSVQAYFYDDHPEVSAWGAMPYVYPYPYLDEDAGVEYETYEVISYDYKIDNHKGVIEFTIEDLNRPVPASMDKTLRFKVIVITNPE